MRVLAIGLGGAGSRIVDHLYDHDQRSRVHCMKALAIDLDPNTLQQLRFLPHESRLFFPPIDPHSPFDVETSIHIEEVMTRLHQIDTSQIDAVLICAGLGGTLVDAAPKIAREVRKAFREPIFGVATLPCRKEGRRRAAKAMDDVEMIGSFADALILFDNELWYGRLKREPPTRPASGKGAVSNLYRVGLAAGATASNPRDVYAQLNERIARYLGLTLRAGEFTERGVEVAEVVLDAGEVLNTITGMGMVSIGYAAEMLPSQTPSILDLFRSKKPSMEELHEKAARIVSLAKKAVYEETSISCDLTSAEKALVLIAGPSHELSMRGFQTVRRWIDRSISGLEMRSGDYPVRNTRFVGIIVMLAGLRNIPRIEELREIREQYRQETGALPAVTKPATGDATAASEAPQQEAAATEAVLATEQPQLPPTGDRPLKGGSEGPAPASGRRGRWKALGHVETEALALLRGIKDRCNPPSGAEDSMPAAAGMEPPGDKKTVEVESSTAGGSKIEEKEASRGERRTRRKKKGGEDFGITWIR